MLGYLWAKSRFHSAPAPPTELVHGFMGLWNPPFSPKNSPRLALGEHWLMGPPYSYPVHSSLLGWSSLLKQEFLAKHVYLLLNSPCWQLRPSGGRTVCVAVRQCGSESKRDWAHDRNLGKSEKKPNSGSSGSKNSGARNSDFQNYGGALIIWSRESS